MQTHSTLSISVQFLDDLAKVSEKVSVTTLDGEILNLDEGLSCALKVIRKVILGENKLIFVGNGGSAAIASHQAVDYWKNGGMPALAFNDSSLLTCISNDYGYERVFAEPILRFANTGDLLIAISSSGKSPNILEAVSAARERQCEVLTYSGFAKDNPLRSLGTLNFHVSSNSYGIVEITHLSLLHAMLEELILERTLHGQ